MTKERNRKCDRIEHNDQSTYEFAMWEGWPSPQHTTTRLIPSTTVKINERESHGRQERHSTHR